MKKLGSNTIIATRTLITAGMGILKRLCTPITGICRWQSPVTTTGSEPQLIKKYQNTVTQDREEKILSMYAKGMATRDIESYMKELYDMDISDSIISRITDKILPVVKEWQEPHRKRFTRSYS